MMYTLFFSSIKYITNPPSIVFSVPAPDTVKPAGITAVSYFEAVVAFSPAFISGNFTLPSK